MDHTNIDQNRDGVIILILDHKVLYGKKIIKGKEWH